MHLTINAIEYKIYKIEYTDFKAANLFHLFIDYEAVSPDLSEELFLILKKHQHSQAYLQNQ